MYATVIILYHTFVKLNHLLQVCNSDYIDIIPDENVPTRPQLPPPRQISSSRNLLQPSSDSRDMPLAMSNIRDFHRPRSNSKDTLSPRLSSGDIHRPLSDRNYIPRLRSESTVSSISDNSEIFDRQWSPSSTSSCQPSDNNAISGTCSRRTTLSESCMSSSEPTSSYKEKRRAATSATTRSTHSSDNLPSKADISFVSPSASLSSNQNSDISINTATQRYDMYVESYYNVYILDNIYHFLAYV